MTDRRLKTGIKKAEAAQPGGGCKADPGHFRPVVDVGRCEGKAQCVSVCPYGVFQVGRVDEEVFRTLPLLVKLKLWAHGKKTAYTPHSDACHACGLCVTACPEHAIRLVRLAPHPE